LAKVAAQVDSKKVFWLRRTYPSGGTGLGNLNFSSAPNTLGRISESGSAEDTMRRRVSPRTGGIGSVGPDSRILRTLPSEGIRFRMTRREANR
jgi:hypothetical protein